VSIIDNGTGQRINLGKDIIIGDRVWVCEKVHILKGANIGSDSVIGTCSVVTKGNYLNNSLLAGNPAKIRKSNISWLAERIYG
jgi:acetyltransferase-like isoleucine patch superfamily enzyme